MFRVPKFSWDQFSSYPQGYYRDPSYRLLDLLNWIRDNTLPVPEEWVPYYRFMHGPMMGIEQTINFRPTNRQEFHDLMGLYRAIYSMQQNYQARQRFMESLMEAYGLGRPMRDNVPSNRNNSMYWI